MRAPAGGPHFNTKTILACESQTSIRATLNFAAHKSAVGTEPKSDYVACLVVNVG
jgi:hypothetical protein